MLMTTTQNALYVLGQHVTPIDTGESNFGMLVVVTPAGANGPPPHYHEDATELFLGLEGSLEVACDGRWIAVGPGESFIVPKGAVHTFRNATGVEAKWLTTFSPRGFERFFTTFGVPAINEGSLAASVAPELIGRVLAECGQYGMILKDMPAHAPAPTTA